MDIEESFSNMADSVIQLVPKILVFIVIIVIGWIIAKCSARLVRPMQQRWERMLSAAEHESAKPQNDTPPAV